MVLHCPVLLIVTRLLLLFYIDLWAVVSCRFCFFFCPSFLVLLYISLVSCFVLFVTRFFFSFVSQKTDKNKKKPRKPQKIQKKCSGSGGGEEGPGLGRRQESLKISLSSSLARVMTL